KQTNFTCRSDVGFGRSTGRKGAPHTISHGLHGLGRSSYLTLAREGLVGDLA
ncbi:Os10g0323350, partial [Oryza sativa Japonica Group]